MTFHSGIDGIVKVWDLSSGTMVKDYPPPPNKNAVSALAFSPDGAMLAMSLDSDHLKVYNTGHGSFPRWALIRNALY